VLPARDYLAKPGRLVPSGEKWLECAEAGRKPFHTLNPALATGRWPGDGLWHDGRRGQPQTQAAVFSRHVWHGMDLQEAIAAPRWLLGRTWGEDSTTLKIEDGFDEAYAALAQAGHRWNASAQHRDDGPCRSHRAPCRWRFEGATDPRSDGGWPHGEQRKVRAACGRSSAVRAGPCALFRHGGGLYRGWLSPAHRASVGTLAAWMEAGHGRPHRRRGQSGRPYEGTGDGPPLIIASHIDSVRDGGFYDGPLGVMLGVECVAALHEAGRRMPFPSRSLPLATRKAAAFPPRC
jgi:hypothetical protein